MLKTIIAKIKENSIKNDHIYIKRIKMNLK